MLNFWKNGRSSSNCRSIRAIILKLHKNISNQSRNFGKEFGHNRLKRSNFVKFEFFLNSLKILTHATFDLQSWNFVRKCTNTECCLILNFVIIGRDVSFLEEFEWLNFVDRRIKFYKFDVSTKVPLWGSQNQAKYFFNEKTLGNRWGSNLGIPIYMILHCEFELCLITVGRDLP